MSDSTRFHLHPADFDQLTASRRDWIESVLRAWCRSVPLKELRKAEQEWFDIAGRADVNATLWTWAWERFPDIVHPDLAGVNETHEIIVELVDGKSLRGFPDNRVSRRGLLVLVGRDDAGESASFGPFAIDQVSSVERSK